MKKSFRWYGGFSGLTMIVLYVANILIVSETNYAIGEIAGYTSIILSLSFLYFGIRYYRDKQNGGVLTFWQGLKAGLLITLVPAVCFGLADVFYIMVVDPHFYEKYGQIAIAKLKATVPAAQFAEKAAAMKKQAAFFSQPWMDFLLMFANVAAFGIIITVISSFILKRSATKKTIAYANALQ